MLRLWLPILAVSLYLLPAPVCGDDAKELKIIATAKDFSRVNSIGPITLKPGSLAVIRSAEELVAASNKAESAKEPAAQKEIESALAKLLKVDAIDWNKQMVMAAIAQGFDSLKSDGKVLTATYLPYIERPLRATPQPPKVLVLTERFEGQVKFVPKK